MMKLKYCLYLVLLILTFIPFQQAMASSLTASETRLLVDGQPTQFTGINAYSLATYWSHNYGCGGQVEDLDAFFSSLKPNSLVRFWAWQGTMATNPTTKQLDWSGIDRVFDAAERHNQKLIVSLSNQSGQCDDELWKDTNWYNGGYRNVHNNTQGSTPLSYWDYVHQIVPRYKNSPALGMWELMNEPEASSCMPGYGGADCHDHATCDQQMAASSLRSFFDTVGGEVKGLDPNHLIESGAIGSGQCGWSGQSYQYIHQSPGIDVASYHDYESEDMPLPGDQMNGLQTRLSQMAAIRKPLIVGEAGIHGFSGMSGCTNLQARNDKMKAKMDAQLAAGAAAFLPWTWVPTHTGFCNYDIVYDDPILAAMNGSVMTSYPVPISSQSAQPNDIPIPTTVQTLQKQKPDYGIMLDCIQGLTPPKNCDDPAKKALADLDKDGAVTGVDYNIFLREYAGYPNVTE